MLVKAERKRYNRKRMISVPIKMLSGRQTEGEHLVLVKAERKRCNRKRMISVPIRCSQGDRPRENALCW